MQSKLNALNNSSPPPTIELQSPKRAVLISFGIHLALVGVTAPFFFFEMSTDSGLLPVEIFENPQSALSPTRMTEQVPAAQPKQDVQSRQVFGLSKKAVQSDLTAGPDDVSLKAGNTLAAAPDTKTLRDSDADSIPIPTDEFLVSKMPVLTSEVRVPYPDEARKKNIQGAVIMDILVDQSGRVRQVSLVDGPGAGLNEAAMNAILQFKFNPAEVDGKPVAVRIRYAYRFVLEK